jgi:hypothetical protein
MGTTPDADKASLSHQPRDGATRDHDTFAAENEQSLRAP